MFEQDKKKAKKAPGKPGDGDNSTPPGIDIPDVSALLAKGEAALKKSKAADAQMKPEEETKTKKPLKDIYSAWDNCRC